MSAIELATGYVSLVPSAKNIQSGIDKELGAPLEAAARKAGDKAGKTLGQRLSKAATKGTEALAAGVAGVAALAVKNGSALQESQDQLANAINNTGSSYKAQEEAIRKVQKSGEGLGFTYAETNDALTVMTRSTGSTAKGIGLLGIAEDLARAKHIDLATASLAVAKASEGQLKPLKALGIDLPVTAGGAAKTAKAFTALTNAQNAQKVVLVAIHAGTLKHKAAADAMAKANQKLLVAQNAYNKVGSVGDQIVMGLGRALDGTAATAADSFKGKIAALHARFTDMTAQLGLKLIPIIILVGTKIAQLVNFFSQNHAALVALTAAVALFVVAMVTLAIIDKVRKAQEAWVKVQTALNITMGLFPAILIVAAIVAVVAAVIYAYTHFKWFRDAVNKAWQILQHVFNWAKSNWPLLLAILTGPIALAVLIIVKNFSRIRDFASSVITAVKNFFLGIPGVVLGVVTRIINFFRNLPGSILKALGNGAELLLGFGADLVHGIADGIRNAAGSILDAIKGIINKIPGHGLLSKVGGAVGDFLGGIPGFAEGGVVPGPAGTPRLAVVHGGERVLTPRQQASTYLDHHSASTARGARGGPFIGGDVIIQARDTRDAVQELSWMAYASGF